MLMELHGCPCHYFPTLLEDSCSKGCLMGFDRGLCTYNAIRNIRWP